MSKRITAVTMSNFKGNTGTVVLTGKDFFVGPTGVGKSRILDALTISILGYHPKQDKKPMALMKAFGSGNPMSTGIVCEDGTKLTRTFQNKGDKFTSDTDIFPAYQEKKATEKTARVIEEFGNFPEMFDLSEFLGMSSDKQRDFVFKYLQSVGWTKEKVMAEPEIATADPEIVKTIFACWNPTHDTQTGLGNVIAYLKDQISYFKKRMEDTEAAGRQITLIKQQQSQMSLSLIDKLKAEIEEYRAKQIELEKQISTVQESNKNIETQKAEKQKALDALKKKIVDEELNDREAIAQALTEAEIEYKAITTTDSTETRKEYDRLVALKSETEKDKNALDRGIREIEAQISSVQKKKCPLINDECLQDFTKFIETQKALIESTKELNERRIKEISELQSKIDTLKVELDKIETDRKTFTEMDNWIKKLQAALQTIDNAGILEKEIMAIPTPQDITAQETEIANTKSAISLKQSKLTEAEKQKNTLNTLQVTLTDRATTETNLKVYKALQLALGPKGIQGRIVKESLSPMLDDINALLCQIDPTKQFYVELTDEKDNEVFEFMCKDAKGIRPVTSMSSGESVIGYTALIAAFIKLSSPKGKYLLIDNMEHISNRGTHYRDNFLAGINRIAEGFDNIILAGTEECAMPEGWNLVNFY